MSHKELQAFIKELEDVNRKEVQLVELAAYRKELQKQIAQLRGSIGFKIWQGLKKLNGAKQDNGTTIPKIETDTLKFDAVEKPEISIILITYNKWEYTARCLASLQQYIHGIPYEIVIIDNNSTDQTPAELTKIPNISVVHNTENTGFLQACNQAAKLAKGTYLYFLNNDTYITNNAVRPLYDRLRSDASIGIVGSRVIFGTTGQLQEAGCMVWKDGSAYGYGRNDNPDKPEYRFARPVDFCSGVSLLLAKELYHRIGGFDESYAPAYYEEVDLCLNIWKQGLQVYYEPLSVIYHMEYGSSSPEQAAKQMQKNQKKLFEKWEQALAEKPTHPEGTTILKNRDRRTGKTILGIVTTLQDLHGVEQQLALQKLARDNQITIFAIQSENLQMIPYRKQLEAAGVEVMTDERALDQFLMERAGLYTTVVVNPFYQYAYASTLNQFLPEHTLYNSFTDLTV